MDVPPPSATIIYFIYNKIYFSSDVDECSETPNLCGTRGSCTNTPSGSYTCVCKIGYTPITTATGHSCQGNIFIIIYSYYKISHSLQCN